MRRPASSRYGYAPALLAWLLLLTPGSGAAHPHVFVDYAVTVLLAGDAVEGVRLTWTFDDLCSSRSARACSSSGSRPRS
jgi:ABC-type uncharacterized transport system substrate-binding protein